MEYIEKIEKVSLRGTEYEIKEVPLKVLVKTLGLFQDILGQLGGADFQDKGKNVKLLMDLLASSADEVFTFVSMTSLVPMEVVEVLGLVDMIALIKAVLKVNDISSIKKEVGELIKMYQKPEVAVEIQKEGTGSTE